MSSIINKRDETVLEAVAEYINQYNEHNAKSERYLKLAADLYEHHILNTVFLEQK